MARTDIDKLRDQVGTFEAPIGSVQLPETGVRYDKRGNPKPLQSGQDEHPEPAPRGERKPRRPPEPAWSTFRGADTAAHTSAASPVLAGATS